MSSDEAIQLSSRYLYATLCYPSLSGGVLKELMGRLAGSVLAIMTTNVDTLIPMGCVTRRGFAQL